jgi:hypothetical protein
MVEKVDQNALRYSMDALGRGREEGDKEDMEAE